MRVLAAVLSALILAGCTPTHTKPKYPPGYGVTPYPHPTPLPTVRKVK